MSETPDERYVAEMSSAIERIWEIARKEGLDPFATNFELVPATIMYEFGAYGLPGRFSHWTRGKAYYRMKTEYDYGLSKIYELVVNTDPSYAFLMEQNDLLQNKVVVAHVLGHTDFFKNNIYFKHTPPNMIDKVSVNADRIRQYEYDHGSMEVERFLDAVLAIDDHIDPNFRVKRAVEEDRKEHKGRAESPFADLWSPAERKIKEKEEEERHPARSNKRFPPEPEKDLLLFFAQHAPALQPWQRDILMIVREEQQYFVPQMQTKVMNEGWACLVGNSLVLTERGLMPYHVLHTELAQGEEIRVNSGEHATDLVTDRHLRRDVPTIRLRTRRGLMLEGAEEHKLSVGPDQWLALKDVEVGQRIPLAVGTNLWAEALVPLRVPMQVPAKTAVGVAAAGVNVSTIHRYLSSKATRSDQRVATAMLEIGYQHGMAGRPFYSRRTPLVAPTHATEKFGEFLGYLTGHGNIHMSKAAIGYTTGDRELADRYASLVLDLFAIETTPFWDARTISGEGGRWRVVFYATSVLDLLESIGIDLRAKAPQKRIPDVILLSPKSVISAFLRAYFDCDGCALRKAGVLLSTFSDEIARTLQIVLLNYGILSCKHGPNVHIVGRSAKLFEQEIGFGLERKRGNLRTYISQHQWYKEEDPTDEVVSVEHGVDDVYDITVDQTHRYVANGMLHHNSFWHARIMRELDLSDSDFTAFAQMHSGVLAPSRMRINPYHVGYKIFEDIERRWDNPTEEQREKFGWLPGQGRKKIFEVRETESDASLLRNYLTKDLVEELDLYLYQKDGDEWVIAEKNWEKVRDGIVASMTNFGQPYITIYDADFNGNTELLLKHQHEGQDLDEEYAQKTLEYVYEIWTRAVHLDTKIEDEPVRFSYNGSRHARTDLESEGEES